MLHLFSSKEDDGNRVINIKQLRALVRLMFEYLPHDNKAGNLMSALFSLYKGKKQWLEGDQEAEVAFDRMITGPIV